MSPMTVKPGSHERHNHNQKHKTKQTALGLCLDYANAYDDPYVECLTMIFVLPLCLCLRLNQA